VLGHLSACSLCQTLAAVLESVEYAGPAAKHAAGSGRPDRLSTTARYWQWAAAAAVIAIAVSAGWLLQFRLGRALAPTPPAPVVSAERHTQTFALVLEPPAIELPAGALVLRGDGADPYTAALVSALAPFRRGAYGEAAGRLSTLMATYPEEPHALFYLGVSHLLTGQAVEAPPYLERARALVAPGTSLHAEASWYLAAALERTDRADQAVIILTSLCGSGGVRSEQACAALGALLASPAGRGVHGVTGAMSHLGRSAPLVWCARAGTAGPAAV
jgi:hypothetical protein